MYCITRDTQPVGVLCIHLAKLLVLGRLLQFVARKRAGNVSHVRRSTRCVVTLVVLGDMVRRTSPIPHPPSPISPPLLQVGIVGNYVCGARLISTLPQTAAAADAYAAGPQAV